jgi:outer membrane murein-binding lipoprotein Lpp
VAEASAEPRQTPPMDPALWAQLKAEQTARVQADREAEAERMARLTPVTDAEIERYGGDLDSAAAERSAALEEISAEVGTLGAKVDELARQDAERAAGRAEITQAAIDEPSVREPQAEQDAEPEMEIG